MFKFIKRLFCQHDDDIHVNLNGWFCKKCGRIKVVEHDIHRYVNNYLKIKRYRDKYFNEKDKK